MKEKAFLKCRPMCDGINRKKAIRLIHYLAGLKGKKHNAIHSDIEEMGYVSLSSCSPLELKKIISHYGGNTNVMEEKIIYAVKAKAIEAGIGVEGLSKLVSGKFKASSIYEMLSDKGYRRIRGLFKVIKAIKDKNKGEKNEIHRIDGCKK